MTAVSTMHVLHVHDAGKKKKKTTLARLDQQPTGHTQNTASFHVQYGAFHLMHGVLNNFTLPKSSAVTARPHCGLVSLELMSVKSPPDCSNHHGQQNTTQEKVNTAFHRNNAQNCTSSLVLHLTGQQPTVSQLNGQVLGEKVTF